jgi:hypothetical protein
VTSVIAFVLPPEDPGGDPAPAPIPLGQADVDAIAAGDVGALDRAGMLVVPDAAAFPFAALDDAGLDVPLVLGLPSGEVDAIESAQGRDLLDHLTVIDTVVGAPALATVVAGRLLPTACHVARDPMDVSDLLACAGARRRTLTALWQQRGGGPERGDLDGVADPVDLRAIKARLRTDQLVLRDALRGVGLTPPPRVQRAGIVARHPEAVAPALAGTTTSWDGVDVVGAGSRPTGLDLAVLVGDVLHRPMGEVTDLLGQCRAALRPGGWLLALCAVVPDARQPAEDRPVPLNARAVVNLAVRVGLRVLDVRAVRHAGDDHHRAGLFVFTTVA